MPGLPRANAVLLRALFIHRLSFPRLAHPSLASLSPRRSMSSNPLPAFDRAFKPQYTESPNPGFALGQKVSDTAEGRQWLAGEKEGWKTRVRKAGVDAE